MEALDEDEQEEELLRMEACLDEQELEEERVEQVHQARATAGGAAVSVSQTTRSSSGLELDENEYGVMYPSEDEQGFVEQWKRRLNSDDGLMASLWSMMLSVTGGVESAAFFKSLGGGHCKQSVCAKVWKRGSIAYRCLVCEVDPTSGKTSLRATPDTPNSFWNCEERGRPSLQQDWPLGMPRHPKFIHEL